MKLTLSSAQLLNLVQDNVPPRINEVEVTKVAPLTMPPQTRVISTETFDANASIIADEIALKKNSSSHYLNKVLLVKAVRTMTGLGLRDSKVLVEGLVDGYCNSL